MKSDPADCARFQFLMGDLPEESAALSDAERQFVAEHALVCENCATLENDLRKIRAAAVALPQLAPARDLWPAIAERIEAPVIELNDRSAVPHKNTRRLFPAAAALVIFTAGITYGATRLVLHDRLNASSGAVASAQQVSEYVPSIAAADPNYGKIQAVAQTYREQILALQGVLTARTGRLDQSTIRIIEENMRVIDGAISASMSALAQDPSSSFLFDRYRNAIDAKVALLRVAVSVPVGDD